MFTLDWRSGPPSEVQPTIIWLVFWQSKLLLSADDQLPQGVQAPVPASDQQFVGLWDGVPCWAVRAQSAEPPPHYHYQPLRQLLDETMFMAAARGSQLLEWARTHQFCGVCATPLQQDSAEVTRICPQCGLRRYPLIHPAVIIAITKENCLLLAHNRRHPSGFYSVLAGFVEAGENLEQCIHREVSEEVGISVTNLRYIASQAWPFPHSLMVGFVAEYVRGEVTVDGVELESADWFALDDLPDYPAPPSIANALIHHLLQQNS